jgi:hypothetical protein
VCKIDGERKEDWNFGGHGIVVTRAAAPRGCATSLLLTCSGLSNMDSTWTFELTEACDTLSYTCVALECSNPKMPSVMPSPILYNACAGTRGLTCLSERRRARQCGDIRTSACSGE